MYLVKVISPAEVNDKRVSKKDWQVILFTVSELGHNTENATICFVERHLQNVFIYLYMKGIQ